MKRRFCIGLCCAILIVFFSALSFGAEKITITYGVPGYSTWDKVLQDLKTMFEAKNPNIAIKIMIGGAALQDIKAGTEADVAKLHGSPDTVYEMRAQGPSFMDLRQLLDKTPGLKADLYPGHLAQYDFKGELMALPYEAITRVYYWNKDIYKEVGLNPDKAPVTWNDLNTHSDKVTKKDAKGGLLRVGYIPVWGNTFFPIPFWQSGGQFFKDVYGKLLATFNDKAGVEALTWMVDTANRAASSKEMLRFSASIGMPGWGNTAYFGTPAISNPFLSKKTAMIGEGVWFLGGIATSAPDMNFGIAPIPYNKVPGTWGDISAIVMSQRLADDPTKLAAAWEFVKFLYSVDAQVAMSLSEASILPVTKSAAKDPRLIKDKKIGPFLGAIESIKGLPRSPVAGLFWQVMGYDMVQEAMYFVKTPQKALDDAVDKINKALEEYYAAQPK